MICIINFIITELKIIINKLKMVRSYNRKANGADDCAETVNAAVQDDGHSLREAQERFRVNYRTLNRCIKARQTNPANTSIDYALPGKVLPDNFEKDLAKYVKKNFTNFLWRFVLRFVTAYISTWNRKQCSNAPVLNIK